MMKYSKLLSFAIFLTAGLFYSCIDPYEFPFEQESETLVVEGVISNGLGPYSIRLSTTRPYETISQASRPAVRGAKVEIADNTGNREELLEISPGEYQTSSQGIQGVPGREYTLIVETAEGEIYQTSPQRMPQPIPIEEVYVEQTRRTELNEVGNEVEVSGIEVFVNTQDPETKGDAYLWNLSGTYQIKTFPELHEEKAPFGFGFVPAPKDCCATCWVTELFGKINVENDDFFNGSSLNGRNLGFIPLSTERLRVKYLVEVEQLTLSPEAYRFWKAIEDQQNNVGSIFDPAPARIQGNVRNVTNPDELVLGFFLVTSKSRVNTAITNADYSLPLPTDAPVNDDCRLLRGASANRPPQF